MALVPSSSEIAEIIPSFILEDLLSVQSFSKFLRLTRLPIS